MKYIYPVVCETVPKIDGQWVDSRCCSVLTLCHAFGLSFEEAQKITDQWGRKRNEGMSVYSVMLMLYAAFSVDLGVVYGSTSYSEMFNDVHLEMHDEFPKSKKGCTLGTFMKDNDQGTYVVFLRGHVTVVKGGKLMDYNCRKNTERVYYSIKVKD